MQSKAFRCIAANFGDVAFTNEFLHVSVEELCNILCSDEIVVRDEAELYTATNRWINYDTEERKQYFGELFSKVMFFIYICTVLTTGEGWLMVLQ